mmetsp:Transcript_60506/g.198047  ORF Transcript_60506/g.198047 Transcript_60506/m.198047 type:complete len:215 (-) Transcript_60506:1091-1735(-)
MPRRPPAAGATAWATGGRRKRWWPSWTEGPRPRTPRRALRMGAKTPRAIGEACQWSLRPRSCAGKPREASRTLARPRRLPRPLHCTALARLLPAERQLGPRRRRCRRCSESWMARPIPKRLLPVRRSCRNASCGKMQPSGMLQHLVPRVPRHGAPREQPWRGATSRRVWRTSGSGRARPLKTASIQPCGSLSGGPRLLPHRRRPRGRSGTPPGR